MINLHFSFYNSEAIFHVDSTWDQLPLELRQKCFMAVNVDLIQPEAVPKDKMGYCRPGVPTPVAKVLDWVLENELPPVTRSEADYYF